MENYLQQLYSSKIIKSNKQIMNVESEKIFPIDLYETPDAIWELIVNRSSGEDEIIPELI